MENNMSKKLYTQKKSKFKGFLNHIFIDGLSGMALGLFATLIIGTILQRIGILVSDASSVAWLERIGDLLFAMGKVAASLTGAGIGCGVAYKYKASPLVLLSAATAGMVGGFASALLSGTVISGAVLSYSGPGEPLGAFIAAYVAIEIGSFVSGKTKLDILVTPFVGIVSGSAVGLLIGPPISSFVTWLGSLVNWGVEQAPFTAGIIVSVLMGIFLTLPISSAAIGIALGLNGIAAGAAVAGCCAHMVGFAFASFRDNGFGGLLAQGVGTSMLQMPNIVKKPVIALPAIIASIITGPVSTCVFHMTNNATGSGMGSAGLVGQIMGFQTMAPEFGTWPTLGMILLVHFILPAVISFLVSELMRKKQWILTGDMKLDV